MNQTNFWVKVNKTETCWLWVGAKDRDGYGMFGTSDGVRRVHRLSYSMSKGDIPKGLVIDHVCRVRNCVNPSHLEAVSQRENTVRGRTVLSKKSDLPVGVKLSPVGNYIAMKRIKGEKQYLGTYRTPEEAHIAYKKG